MRFLTSFLLTTLVALLLIDPWLHHHTPVSGALIGLFVWVSLFGCLLCLVATLFLGPLISRQEDYYD